METAAIVMNKNFDIRLIWCIYTCRQVIEFGFCLQTVCSFILLCLWSQTDACEICFFDPYDEYYGLVSPGKGFYNHISWYSIDIPCLEPLESPNNQFLEIYAFCTNSNLLWQILNTFWLCLLISAPLEENRPILLAPKSIYV